MMASKVLVKAFCLSVVIYASLAYARSSLSRGKRSVSTENCPTPPGIQNGDLDCDYADEAHLQIFCTYTCHPGYKFEGIADKDMVYLCDVETGFFENVEPNNCVPDCNPPCLNGGECAVGNRCICSPPYYGEQCLHTRQTCNSTSAPRFGSFDCTPDGDGGKTCIPQCLPTFVFETTPPEKYVCTKDGTWTPDINKVPDCIQEILQPTTKAVTTTIPRIVSEAMCGAWGTNHYRTFDNKVYTFDGACYYTLVFVQGQFEISARNNPTCAGGTNCNKEIIIYQGGAKITLSVGVSGPEIHWNDQLLTIPGFKDGAVFEKAGSYITFSSSLGYSIKWDGKLSVFVKVTDVLKGKITGLCGLYNGNPTDDFRTQSGASTTVVADFASSWKKTIDGKVCIDGAQKTGCDAVDVTVKQISDNSCQILRSDPAFSPCHAAVDPAEFIDSCKTDCCNSNNAGSCACDTLEAYSRSCMDKGIKLNWRNSGRCEIQCPAGQVYKECGSTCVKYCTNANVVCTDPTCIDGCFCPDGEVMHENKCIPATQCPCVRNGHSYNEGTVVPDKCNNCTCHTGAWNCTRKSCDKTCSATGDPHYETFDGKRFNFMGTCSYYLMKDKDFNVIVDNIQCGHGEASCTKSISIDINGLIIKLDHNHQLFINGREITSLPYVTPDIKVTMVSSLFMQATLSNGVSILWDGRTRAYIKAPVEFMHRTQGLCGTFDGDQNNDFRLPDMSIETNPNIFGNQWKTETSCADILPNSTGDPCDANPEKKDQALLLCSKLKSDTFKDCARVEPVDSYYEDCVYDLCSCSENMKDCMCPNIGSYADTCASKGVKINWRMQITECMLQCPAGQQYTVCAKPCERTCRDIAENRDELCDAKCVEGCNCPPGETLNDQNQCVPLSQCPCIFDGRQYPAGYTTIRGEEICVCDGAKFTCSKFSLTKIPQEITSLCPNTTVYTKCLSKCPVTCENSNNPPTCSNTGCTDGCECLPGLVLDGDKCINASTCPCMHAGKAYYEGEKYFQDCNECTCNSRQWHCTQNKCPSICNAYGDSHYTTFDGRHYEFQGVCDYVLVQSSQGVTPKFSITTRNTQCGTSGVTCFKQLDFVVGTEGTDDFYKLQLIRGQSVVPDPGSPFTVKEVGDMVYITTPFGVTLQWDKQTRVYVRLSTDHMEHVEGLCGNFNHDQDDDFTLKQGGSVSTPTLFADSWKVQSSCAPSQEITDTCAKNPQRKAWAQQKCAVINSDLFEPCHSVVDRTEYVKRCIYDSCACDLGGDCECLCTAIAAYGHECAINGIYINWRSNDLCPIQCEQCEVFNPCMTLCPKKTCDNRNIYSAIEKDCNNDKGICFEGCDLRPCPAGQVYDSMIEPVSCIPEPLCETPACNFNGKIYREGERVEDPKVCNAECEICICHSGDLEHITFGKCDVLVSTSIPNLTSSNEPGHFTSDNMHTTVPFDTVRSKGIFRSKRR